MYNNIPAPARNLVTLVVERGFVEAGKAALVVADVEASGAWSLLAFKLALAAEPGADSVSEAALAAYAGACGRA